MGEEETPLGASPAVRVGDTVRRPCEPWTPAVHAVLRHLEKVGFEGAPRVLGIDEQGREVLTYLPSEPTWPYTEKALVGTAQLLRSLHESLDVFTAPADAVWALPDSWARAAASGTTTSARRTRCTPTEFPTPSSTGSSPARRRG